MSEAQLDVLFIVPMSSESWYVPVAPSGNQWEPGTDQSL